LSFLCIPAALASDQLSGRPVDAQPVAAAAFARRPAISNVRISSDGKHIVAITSSDGLKTTVSIWRADDLRAAPYVIGTDPRSEIIGVNFIKNDRLFVTTQQLADFDILGEAQKSYVSRSQIIDLTGNPSRINLRFEGFTAEQQAFVGLGVLVSALPLDPQHILVRSPLNADVFRVNLYTGRSERIERGSTRFWPGLADFNGNIRVRYEFATDDGAIYIGIWLKDAQEQWDIHFKHYARDRRNIDVISLTNDPNIVLVSSDRDRDRKAIYQYNIAERQLGDIVFEHPVFESGAVVRSENPDNLGDIIGFSYEADRSRILWTDAKIERTYDEVRSALRISDVPIVWADILDNKPFHFSVGDGVDLDIIDHAQNYERLVFAKSGGSAPPEYYVMIDGQVTLLGRAYPELRQAPLGSVSLVQYQARDGLMIPAFLIKPDPAIHGNGPYPTIVAPHGGPWTRDAMVWEGTGWTQYFAQQGYAVVQPQFRGSLGWGQRLWRAGDGEWGRKMQDDIDDAARYLIAQGIASSDRIAVHGYSYGGYAAMMAAVRPNGLYQCAIAGAGPATIDQFKKATYRHRYQREFHHPTVEGEDPLRRVDEIQIPLFLYTGDRDTQVLPSESRAMASAMQRAGKTVKLTILPDMEHAMVTWSPANRVEILTSIERYLKNDCGPGGL